MRTNSRKGFYKVFALTAALSLFAFIIIFETLQNGKEPGQGTSTQSAPKTEENADHKPDIGNAPAEYIFPAGMTIETRINPPEGYHRSDAKKGSFLEFTRALELKPDGSAVILYNGSKKSNQTAQAAIFALDVGDKDLQQCADSIMRVYAEYYWQSNKTDKIKFHLTNGFLMDYANWRKGNRIKVDGNSVSWISSNKYDDSYLTFRKYLTNVMVYAGTMSLDAECKILPVSDLKAGDLILKGGSPGHCVLVVDTCINDNGEKCYLLAQGYMPAQDFHVLKNPKKDGCPWYFKEDFTGTIETPEYTFVESNIKRWNEGFE